MGAVISGILAMRIIVQFIGQAVGLSLLHRKKQTDFPYKMPLYPLPIILAILMWFFVFYATGLTVIVSFLIVLTSGVAVFLVKSHFNREWPFENVQRKT
jgi:uncharacterized membrane protein